MFTQIQKQNQDLLIQISQEREALFAAITRNEDIENIKSILNRTPKISSAQNDQGLNALMHSLECKKSNIAALLIEKAIEQGNISDLITACDCHGQTALAYAIRAELPEIAKKLLNIPGINIRHQLVNVKNEVREHLFMEACRAFKANTKSINKETKEHIKMLEALALDNNGKLAIPADVLLAKNPAGEVVLFQAVHHCVLPLVQTLLQWHGREQLNLINNYFKNEAEKHRAFEYTNLQEYATHLAIYKPRYQLIADYLVTFERGYLTLKEKAISRLKDIEQKNNADIAHNPSNNSSNNSSNNHSKPVQMEVTSSLRNENYSSNSESDSRSETSTDSDSELSHASESYSPESLMSDDIFAQMAEDDKFAVNLLLSLETHFVKSENSSSSNSNNSKQSENAAKPTPTILFSIANGAGASHSHNGSGSNGLNGSHSHNGHHSGFGLNSNNGSNQAKKRSFEDFVDDKNAISDGEENSSKQSKKRKFI